MALALLPVLLVATFGVFGPPASAESITYEELVFTTHAGPGKHPKKNTDWNKIGEYLVCSQFNFRLDSSRTDEIS